MARGAGHLAELIKSLGSRDRYARRMAFVFWTSAASTVLTVSLGGWQLWQDYIAESAANLEDTETAENLSRLVSRQKSSATAHASTLGLGRFHFELRAPAGKAGAFSNSAEVEIFIECDRKATCDQIEANPTALRDRLSTGIVLQDRDSLLTADGKIRLKRVVQRRLNELVTDGSIKNVYFSDLILN